jgi:hypothetical protein
MLELLAKVEQTAVPIFVTLTYPDNFPPYREDYNGHLEAFCDRIQRRWPAAAIIWKLEFKARKSGKNKGKIAPHYHLFLFGVPWRFRFKEERGESVSLCRMSVHEGGEHWQEEIEADGSKQCARMSAACSTDAKKASASRWTMALGMNPFHLRLRISATMTP